MRLVYVFAIIFSLFADEAFCTELLARCTVDDMNSGTMPPQIVDIERYPDLDPDRQHLTTIFEIKDNNYRYIQNGVGTTFYALL